MRILGRKTLRVFALEFQSHAGTAQIGHQKSVFRSGCAVEKHVLDARMIMKILDMADFRQRTAGMAVD